MPEIWVNYGTPDVVLDVRAENLDEVVSSSAPVMEEQALSEKLAPIAASKKPVKLVPLHYTRSVQKVISDIFTLCQLKSAPAPRVLADRSVSENLVLPEDRTAEPFSEVDSELVFVSEMELDGLFGFETTATRLLRRFGAEQMLTAYARRASNEPAPCQKVAPMEEAKKFADGFEVSCIDILASSKGISDIAVGHPSSTVSLCPKFESMAVRDIGVKKTIVAGTGTPAASSTLSGALDMLWTCGGAVAKGGLLVLLAECPSGLGSEALRQTVEGRLKTDRITNPSKYVDGLEDILYLRSMQDRFQTGIVSILPEQYTKKLGFVPLSGAKRALEYILRTQGARQKVTIVTDALRLLLR